MSNLIYLIMAVVQVSFNCNFKVFVSCFDSKLKALQPGLLQMFLPEPPVSPWATVLPLVLVMGVCMVKQVGIMLVICI